MRVDGGHSGDGSAIADAGPIADADTARDSQVDGGDSCTDGATMACTTSEPGECATGAARCVSGAWGACERTAEPTLYIGVSIPDAACGETREDFVAGCSASCETNYETRTQSCR